MIVLVDVLLDTGGPCVMNNAIVCMEPLVSGQMDIALKVVQKVTGEQQVIVNHAPAALE